MYTMRIELDPGDEIIAACPMSYNPPGCVGAYLVFTRAGYVWQIQQHYAAKGTEFTVHKV